MQFSKSGVLTTLGFLALTGVPASAQTVFYPNFASTAGLSLQGTAVTAKTADGTVLRLAQSTTWQAGTAFTAATVPFSTAADTFSTYFQFRITNPGGIAPADGIVFVIRDAGTPALGQVGGAVGYDGIGHSIGVKFDTYQNDREINDNHVAIQTNGVWLDEFTQTPYGVGNCLKPTGVAGCMSNGHLWSVWIDYDGVSLHVAVADGSTRRPADLVGAPVSLPSILNLASAAYVGFTGATGAGTENHDILNWQYSNTYNPTPVGFDQTLQSAPISRATDLPR